MINTAEPQLRTHPTLPQAAPSVSWRQQLPALVGSRAVLRELDPADAPALLEVIASPEVARYISPPPQTVAQLERFIDWGRAERSAGRYAGFAIVPHGHAGPAGLLQVRQLQDRFVSAEWGIVIGAPYWGAGLFSDAAVLLASFAFTALAVHRLEARAAVPNARAHAAMQKLGAIREGVLRHSLLTADGSRYDQVLWSLLADDWRARTASRPRTQVH